MANFRVHKTLVIGLGSTGTRICDKVAERIRWEVGSLERAPWVEFLVIETNKTQESTFAGTDNFRALEIKADAYADIINHPENYDGTIGLTRWADINTLRQLKTDAVNAGAGNIRMVGRLALLYPDNYTTIRKAITTRLAQLRALTAAEARVKLNKDAIGLASDIEFADPMAVRIVVAGTLLGGTCSGSAADMGIILRMLADGADRITGVFTLPHEQYSIATDPLAELRKKNAYHALQELNDYQNYRNPKRFRTIKYVDKAEGDPPIAADKTPFNLIYLVKPRENSFTGEQALNGAVGEHIFLNIFVANINPFPTIVDGAVFPPKNGQCYTFATFGLSTIEYPVRRVIEAGKLKVLAHALYSWNNRKFDGKLDDHLDDIGLTQQEIQERLLTDAGGTSIRSRLTAQLDRARNAARNGNVAEARKQLEELRAAFQNAKGDELRGLAWRTLEANRATAAGAVLANTARYVREHLLDYDFGPAALVEVLDGVTDRLAELASWQPVAPKPEGVNNLLDKIERLQHNLLLGSFGLRGKAIRAAATPLGRALNDELKARLDQATRGIMTDAGSGMRTTAGTLSVLDEALKKLRRRVANLRSRVSSQAAEYQTAAGHLENEDPAIIGLSLFERSPDGTVAKEFARALPDNQLERLSMQLIRGWTELLAAVWPEGAGKDWLLDSFTPGGEKAFESDQLRDLQSAAVEPFLRLADPSNKDVITRLFEMGTPGYSPEKQAQGAAEQSRTFLNVIETVAAPDPMTPVKRRKLLLGNAVTDKARAALSVWRNHDPEAREEPYPDPFRVAMIEEWFFLPLRGVTDVTERLAKAQSDVYGTYFTRKRADMNWTPLSEEEFGKLRHARALVLKGVLHGVLTLGGGSLRLPWDAEPGEPNEPELRTRLLPTNIEAAARMLAFEKVDRGSKHLNNVATRLDGLIEDKVRAVKAAYPDLAGANRGYVRFLSDALLTGQGKLLSDWNEMEAKRLVLTTFQKEPGMLSAYWAEFPPNPAMMGSLRRSAGEARPKGNGVFEKAGYYCRVCGGPVGTTEDDAMEHAMLCEYYPDEPNHPFAGAWDPFAAMATATAPAVMAGALGND